MEAYIPLGSSILSQSTRYHKKIRQITDVKYLLLLT